MDQIPTHHKDNLAAARARCAEDLKTLAQVRGLLAKADRRRVVESEDARKWNRVLESLERSLDLTKARYELSVAQVERLEREAGLAPSPGPPSTEGLADPGDAWGETMRRVEGLTLEEASQLQSDIDSGNIDDAQLEAGLALANQMSGDPESEAESGENRRQLALRAAIDKIGKRRFDQMSLEEIKLVLACHSLLTSRLEPTPRDQRLRRILDGAIKILQRRKEQMERLQGGNPPK